MLKQSLFLLFSITTFSVLGQGLFESFTAESDTTSQKKRSIEFSGYVRGSAYGGSENYDYTNVFGEFALKSKLTEGKSFLFADVRLRNGLFFNNRETQIQLKEAYAGYTGTYLDVYLGNQIITWGRADGFNPTNCITPNDYFFLTHEPDDQKLSNFLLRSKLRFSNSIDLELIAIPFYSPSNYRYDLFNEQEGVNYHDVNTPSVELKNGSLAAKLNFELPSAGFSFSYFNGYDPYYGFTLKNFTLIPLEINYVPTPYHKQVFGVDFALPIISWIFRGEGVFNLTSDYKANMHIPNPDIYYVFGVERSFFDITAIVQYISRYTLDFSELEKPVLGGYTQEDFIQYGMEMIPYESEMYNRRIFYQQKESNHALMMSLSRSFLYDELRTEITGYYNITSEEYMIRPSVKWSVTDAVSVNIGASLLYGPEETLFYMSKKVLNAVFIGLDVKF